MSQLAPVYVAGEECMQVAVDWCADKLDVDRPDEEGFHLSAFPRSYIFAPIVHRKVEMVAENTN